MCWTRREVVVHNMVNVLNAVGSFSLKQLISPNVNFASVIKTIRLGRGELDGPLRSPPQCLPPSRRRLCWNPSCQGQ